MRRFAIAAAATALALAAAAPARANDSSAELATGGLVFVQNADVAMRSEDLFISAEKVRVTYKFFNASDKAVSTLVAFPMPDVRFGMDSNIVIPTEDPVNVLGFSTKVNGEGVTTQVQQRVYAFGIDRTATLQQLGIPLAPQAADMSDKLAKLPAEKRDELVRTGMIELEDGISTYGARWTLKTVYFWEQTFPAKTEITIEHAYTPSVGGSVGSLLSLKPPLVPEIAQELAAYRGKYCLDNEFLNAVKRAKGLPQTGYQERRIAYILTTGANWAGPIGDFRLVVDKAGADLVSFCGDGVKKISATQFEMRKKDFTPEKDLFILMLVKPEP